jgi:histidinol phosphatase-like PHP family hydrolase
MPRSREGWARSASPSSSTIELAVRQDVDLRRSEDANLAELRIKPLDLQRLDLGAVHYKFELDSQAQAERILRAMDSKYLSILAHPTGRLLGERPEYAVDLDRVVEGAKERGVALSSRPTRRASISMTCIASSRRKRG